MGVTFHHVQKMRLPRFSFRLQKRDLDLLRETAKKRGVTPSAVVRDALLPVLEAEQQKAPAA